MNATPEKRRRVLLFGLLIATLVATYATARREQHIASPATVTATAPTTPKGTPRNPLSPRHAAPPLPALLEKRELVGDATGLFRSPLPPPVLALPAVESVEPAESPPGNPSPEPLPPLPFEYLGQAVWNNTPLVLLVSGGRNEFLVSPGDNLTKIYKLELVEEEGIHLRHLPTNKLQVLAIDQGTP